MQHMWQTLIGNLAVIGLILSVWAHLSGANKNSTRSREKLMLGLFLGLATSASMIMSFPIRPGVLVDLRAGLIALAGLEAGLPGLAIAAAVSALTRLMLGGEGLALGMESLAIFSAVGLTVRHLTANRFQTVGKIISLAGGVSLVMTVSMWTVAILREADAFKTVAIPLLSLNVISIVICGSIIHFVKTRNLDNAILAAALAQSPDYLYIKNRDSRFLHVNNNTAAHNGFERSGQMAGLSDFHIAPQMRAETLFLSEQDLMRNRQELVDHREEVGGKVFMTSKYPLCDTDDRVIGLIGISRDVTQKEMLERELAESRTTLSDALEALHDGLAIFNHDGVLLRCNRQYQAAFPKTGSARQPGETLANLLDDCARAGEFTALSETQLADWKRAVTRRSSGSSAVELHLFNDIWLKLKVHWSGQGAVVLATDITDTKRQEAILRDTAQAYRLLAETDPLTGLLNRRAFDDRAAVEMARHGRSRSPLSVMMIDVDLFKAFNDSHGHHEGDECLKKVANCLRDAAKRPADIVARFGGEEFIVLLPDTDESGAAAVARDFAAILTRRDIGHLSSPHGRVTASIGIASVSAQSGSYDKSALIRQADTALYAAKRKGRNRAEVWSRTFEQMDQQSLDALNSFVI
ncbi:diguanylate cyclase [Rhizobium sp. NRK18]|uniref:diguanylate cyclase n=1 Tax=Rhizobium sp. NRK18 TaxID=2964667 RepID=UPI0021C330F1|nr:diguanylate cyclase [Rhizobium sp. NRK18]MCQ2003663.1 diguanylate cyclase [Rhizobium sp. NRK18]